VLLADPGTEDFQSRYLRGAERSVRSIRPIEPSAGMVELLIDDWAALQL
jgi:hypothetical protein